MLPTNTNSISVATPGMQVYYNALWKITRFEKKIKSALNFGPSQRTLNFFFFTWDDIHHINALLKKSKIKFCMACFIFLVSNFQRQLFILEINRSFQMFNRRFPYSYFHLSRFWSDFVVCNMYIRTIST